MLRSVLLLALILQAPAAVLFDSNRAWEDLRQLVALGPRPAGSTAIDQSRTYIKHQSSLNEPARRAVSTVNFFEEILGT